MTNGARPLAPVGGHSSQTGTLLNRAVVPVAEEPPEPVLPDGALPPPPALDVELDAAPRLDVDPVVAPPAVVAVWGAVAEAAGAAALVVVGRVTAP